MKIYQKIVSRIYWKIIEFFFVIYIKYKHLFYLKQKARILFSDKRAWKQDIKKGFRFTRYEIEFGEITSDSIKSFTLVVPLSIDDLMYLNKFRGLFDEKLIPIPSINSILICEDKYVFNQTLIERGFGDYIPKIGGQLQYPYILKKKIDAWGENSHIISNEMEERSFTNILTDPNYFTQEVIAGSCEYATHILFKNNKIISSLNIKYVFDKELPVKGKDKQIYKRISQCPYLDTFSSILSSLGYEGLCCVNYKVRNRALFILEINPRFGGSLSPYFFYFVDRAILE